jgi:hypothetical protein
MKIADNEAVTFGATLRSLEVFRAYAEDAINWDGVPLLSGNAAERGNVTHLKRAGFIDTFTDEGCTWIYFTDRGRDLAEAMGIDLGEA